jgi:putative pyruvate formate lyase activating enzyme
MKYADAEIALHYSKAPDYPQINQAVVREMHRQVGDLEINHRGIATRGLLVRHLILPNNLAGTEQIVQFLVENISPNTYLNLMDQYHPSYRASLYPELNRHITRIEYQSAIKVAALYGIRRLDIRKDI